MKKHIYAAAIFLSAILMLCACSSSANVTDVTGTPSTEATAAISPTATEPDTTEPTAAVPSDVPVREEIIETDIDYSSLVYSEGIGFSRSSGVYVNGFTLAIVPKTEGKVYYTTDGSNPQTSSTRIEYTDVITVRDRSNDANQISATSPSLFDTANAAVNSSGNGYDSTVAAPDDIQVDKCTVIKAAVEYADGSYSKVATNTYFIGDIAEHIQGISESCAAAGTELAVISISMEYDDLFDSATGIYVKGDIYDEAIADYLSGNKKLKASDARSFAANYTQRGREWEREAHIDFFESDGTASELVLTQDCGIRIQGNYSRSDLQKGFRLYARSSYGENNFDYAVFGDTCLDDNGEVIDKFKTLVLRNGGNCAFTTKYSDTYWQSLVSDMDCDTLNSRPCVVYINGEYWGLYVLQEDYSADYFEDTHGVDKDSVVLYKADAEKYALGYKLDLGDLPSVEAPESFYYQDLINFFNSHDDLKSDEDYNEFIKLVDPDSVLDYFAVEIWINNKWDWPGKNWSMWKTINTSTNTIGDGNEYNDGRWRFCFYDMEFGGVSGAGDATTNTIKEDNYKPNGMLDRNTDNPAVLCFVYLMSNESFRNAYIEKLTQLSSTNFEKENALAVLDTYKEIYTPLYTQFFERYGNIGSAKNSNFGGYASYSCIKQFLEKRESNIQTMVDYINNYYKQ